MAEWRVFEAIGYAQQYPCRQPHEKMANTGDISVLAWVDATNIKTNPRENAVLVRAGKFDTATGGGYIVSRTATNPHG